jgi:hypothetical protein
MLVQIGNRQDLGRARQRPMREKQEKNLATEPTEKEADFPASVLSVARFSGFLSSESASPMQYDAGAEYPVGIGQLQLRIEQTAEALAECQPQTAVITAMAGGITAVIRAAELLQVEGTGERIGDGDRHVGIGGRHRDADDAIGRGMSDGVAEQIVEHQSQVVC